MKRLAILFAVLVAAMTAAAAMAAPAPKTTGGIGYTAYSDVQRHLEFNAIQSKTDTCGTFWDVTSVTSFSFYLGSDLTTPYTHDATLTQSGQSITGVGGGFPVTGIGPPPSNPPYSYWWHVTAGTVSGNVFNLTWVYDGAPDAAGAVTTMTGTIAPNGSIAGTWQDNYPPPSGSRTGTFTAPAGSATAYATYCGKGNAYYSDASGLWYFVNVKAVSVSGADAWFAGPVIAGNVGVGNWLFVKVHDGGEPGKLVDQAWGSFTDEISAVNGVTGHVAPGDGPFTITSGNLQVH